MSLGATGSLSSPPPSGTPTHRSTSLVSRDAPAIFHPPSFHPPASYVSLQSYVAVLRPAWASSRRPNGHDPGLRPNGRHPGGGRGGETDHRGGDQRAISKRRQSARSLLRGGMR